MLEIAPDRRSERIIVAALHLVIDAYDLGSSSTHSQSN